MKYFFAFPIAFQRRDIYPFPALVSILRHFLEHFLKFYFLISYYLSYIYFFHTLLGLPHLLAPPFPVGP